MSDPQQAAVSAKPEEPQLSPFNLTTANRYKLFVSIMLSFFFLNVAYASVGGVFVPAQVDNIDAANRETNLAVIMSVASFGTLFVQPIFGAVSDRTRSRFGRRTPWILLGGFVGGAAVIMMQFTTSIALLAIGWLLAQMALNVFQVPSSAIVADRVQYEHRAFGSSFLGVGQTLGVSAGFMTGGYLIANMGVGYTLTGIVMMAWAAIFVVLNRDRNSRSMTLERFRWGDFLLGFVRPLNVRKHPDFVWAWFGRFLMILGYQAIQAYSLYIFQSYIGLSQTEAGQSLAIMNILMMITTAVASLLFGRISDRIGRRKVFVFGASAVMAVAIAMPLVFGTVTSMYAYGLLVGIGYGAYMSVDLALMIDVLPSSGDAGKDLGVMNVATNIPQTLVPVVAAVLLSLFDDNYAVLFVYAILVVIASSLCVFPIRAVR